MDTGSSAFGLSATNGTLWVGATETGELLRIDAGAREITARVPVGRAVLDVCATRDAVWAISALDGTVTRIDALTNAVTNVVEVGERPYACTWAFGHLWVSNGRSGTLTQIDDDARVVATVEIGGEPNGLAVLGNRIYVAEREQGRVVAIDPVTLGNVGEVDLSGADWITPVGDALWVSREPDLVSEVDAASLAVRRTMQVGHNPLGSAIVAGDLWVPCIESDSVEVIDTATGARRFSIEASKGPIMVCAAAGSMWIACWESTSLVQVPVA